MKKIHQLLLITASLIFYTSMSFAKTKDNQVQKIKKEASVTRILQGEKEVRKFDLNDKQIILLFEEDIDGLFINNAIWIASMKKDSINLSSGNLIDSEENFTFGTESFIGSCTTSESILVRTGTEKACIFEIKILGIDFVKGEVSLEITRRK